MAVHALVEPRTGKLEAPRQLKTAFSLSTLALALSGEHVSRARLWRPQRAACCLVIMSVTDSLWTAQQQRVGIACPLAPDDDSAVCVPDLKTPTVATPFPASPATSTELRKGSGRSAFPEKTVSTQRTKPFCGSVGGIRLPAHTLPCDALRLLSSVDFGEVMCTPPVGGIRQRSCCTLARMRAASACESTYRCLEDYLELAVFQLHATSGASLPHSCMRLSKSYDTLLSRAHASMLGSDKSWTRWTIARCLAAPLTLEI